MKTMFFSALTPKLQFKGIPGDEGRSSQGYSYSSGITAQINYEKGYNQGYKKGYEQGFANGFEAGTKLSKEA